MLLSIITVCFNAELFIEKTILSVLCQSYKNIEYLIIDGASTDGTLEIIEKYKSHIDCVVSEQDQGLFYAMNKGLRLMTGDAVLFMNAGDLLADKHVVQDVMKVFDSAESPVDFLYGNVIFDYGVRKQIRTYKRVDTLFFSCSSFCHQTVFARKWLFDKYGFFNETYKVGADLDWAYNLWFNHRPHIKIRYFDRIICVFDRCHGLSSKPFSFLKETKQIWGSYFKKYEWFVCYPICLVRQFIRKKFFEKKI